MDPHPEQLSETEARALQTYLNEAFRRYGLEVGVGLTKHGVAIRSQDVRVDAQNIGTLVPFKKSAP